MIKFKDAVVDSHHHLFEELGIVPTIDDIFSDLDNYEIEGIDEDTIDEYYYSIKEVLDDNKLEYKS